MSKRALNATRGAACILRRPTPTRESPVFCGGVVQYISSAETPSHILARPPAWRLRPVHAVTFQIGQTCFSLHISLTPQQRHSRRDGFIPCQATLAPLVRVTEEDIATCTVTQRSHNIKRFLGELSITISLRHLFDVCDSFQTNLNMYRATFNYSCNRAVSLDWFLKETYIVNISRCFLS